MHKAERRREVVFLWSNDFFGYILQPKNVVIFINLGMSYAMDPLLLPSFLSMILLKFLKFSFCLNWKIEPI